MYSLLKDAQGAASNGLEFASEVADDALSSAKKGADAVRDTAERSASSLLGTALKGLSAAAAVATTLRQFDMDRGLSWFGLARRRSNAFGTFAVFGTGLLIGTGIGCLIAPVSGAEARRAIRARFDDYMKRGARAIRRGEHELEQLEQKAEQIASKVASEASKAASEVKKVATEPMADRANGRVPPSTLHS
jgi:gas vesicle protein